MKLRPVPTSSPAEILAAAFDRVSASGADEMALAAVIASGLERLFSGRPMRYLTLAGTDPLLPWWLGPVLTLAGTEMPYLRQEPGATWILAVDGARCIGFGCVELSRGVATLRHGWVHPERRAEGIAQELLTRRLAWGREQGIARFKATMKPEVAGLFQAEGFAETARRGSYVVLELPSAQPRAKLAA